MDKARLRKLLIPLILEQLLAVSVGIVDTAMVSRVGEAAISGVALVDNLNLLVIQVMAAFSAGGMVVISQYLGDKNETMVKKACYHLEIIVSVFSLLIMGIYLFLGKSILRTLFGKIEEDVMTAAVTYLLVSGVSFLFWGIYTVGAAILRCHEDTKTAMYVSLFINVLNACLNAIFVFVFHMGVLGVAVATLISRAVAGVTMKCVLLSNKHREKTHIAGKKTISFPVIKNILAMAIPSGVENGMFHVGKLIVAGMIATLGTSAMAANSVSYQIIEFPNIPGVTIGLALVVFVGQDIGAGRKDDAVRDTKYLVRLAYFGDWACKFVLFFAAPLIVSIFHLSPEATQISVLVLRCFAIASVPVWPLSFTLPNALRGAGDVRYSMMVSIISMWLSRVVVTYILVMHFNLGILGVWIGMFADWYVRGTGYLLRFLSGKWLNKKIV